MKLKDNYLLFDGAMGSYYCSKTGETTQCETANITNGNVIAEIHKEYIDAGAMAIKTNTFGANPIVFGDTECRQIILYGYRIAKKAVEGTDVKVFADIGPVFSEDPSERERCIKSVIDIFWSVGARNFLFETFDNRHMPCLAAKYIKEKSKDAVVLTSFAVDSTGYTRAGVYFGDIVSEVRQNPHIDGFGFNCICGPAHMCELVKQIEISDSLVTVMPNAGYPSELAGRIVYNDNPMYFAERISELHHLGVKILGGCCGTTPTHIKMAAELLAGGSWENETHSVSVKPVKEKTVLENRFRQKLEAGEKVVLAEFDPPFVSEFEYLAEGGMKASMAGADAVSVTDSPLARSRASSVIIGAKIKREAEIDAIAHITCRDKNLIGMKSTFLAMHIEGLRNVLAITGDPIPREDRNNISGVYSMNSADLAGYIQSLNKDVFCGDELYVGGALNINAVNFDAELEKAKKKIEKGMSYFITQPVFSDEGMENIRRAKQELNAKIIVGIMPIAGYKNALFLNNEVSGIDIPQGIVNAFFEKDRAESERISAEIATATAKNIYDVADGFLIMTQLRRIDLTCNVIEKIKALGKGK